MNMGLLGQRLKEHRQRQRLTQQELAEQSGVPQPLISDLDRGKRTGVTLEMAVRLARMLAVSVDYLAGTWEDEPATEAAHAARYRAPRFPPRAVLTLGGGV
jgi:transcriptional regulator with XRE-family HTH domain